MDQDTGELLADIRHATTFIAHTLAALTGREFQTRAEQRQTATADAQRQDKLRALQADYDRRHPTAPGAEPSAIISAGGIRFRRLPNPPDQTPEAPPT